MVKKHRQHKLLKWPNRIREKVHNSGLK
jgi:hypothetical protein